MPYRCPHCGKEHATLEELQAIEAALPEVCEESSEVVEELETDTSED